MHFFMHHVMPHVLHHAMHSIMMTAVFGVIIVYIYAIVGYVYLSDSFAVGALSSLQKYCAARTYGRRGACTSHGPASLFAAPCHIHSGLSLCSAMPHRPHYVQATPPDEDIDM